jgi:predicted SprT family Zn-dependent metalloprotease
MFSVITNIYNKKTKGHSWRVFGKNLNIVSMCAVSPVVHTSNISSCQKKLFQFSCGCEQFY